MIYTATITSASLRLRECRIIADLLLRSPSADDWKDALFAQNVLQMRSAESIKRISCLLRARIEPLGEELWRMVRDGGEGGGRFVMGVTDKQPRKVVGTRAFRDLSGLKRDLGQRVHLRIDATELAHADGRVVVISVPSRPIGMAVAYKGAYWMRRGEDLVAMSPEVLKRIFDEGQPDYSAEICPAATLADLDDWAILRFRELWMESSGNSALASVDLAQVLEDAELTVDGRVTFAGLILLGSAKGVGRHLA